MSYSSRFFGASASGSVQSLASPFTNGSGADIPAFRPVSLNSSGFMVPLDISNESLVDAFLGLTTEDVPAGASGIVTDCGRLTNITTSYGVGTALYVYTDGTLTNIKPDIANGYSVGDFSVFVGVIVPNNFVSGQYDLKLFLSINGQL
jgi:hypothetical protein